MTILRTKRLSNPRRVAVRGNSATKRKKLSAKQVQFFGTKRQRAALKAKRTHRARTAAKPRKRSHNPALVLTLGPVMNPHKRSNGTMKAKANRKRKRVASNRRRVAKSNSHRPRTRPKTRTITKTVVRYRAKANRKRKNRRNPARRVVVVARNRRRTRRNPSLFGASLEAPKQSLMILGGGGFAARAPSGQSSFPTLLPNFANRVDRVEQRRPLCLDALASALAVAWAAGKFVGPQFGDGALFGGLIQAGSVALNAFLPSVYSSLGIGLGDLLPGSFAVPQNPIRAGMARPALPAPAKGAAGATGGQARVTMSGLARAYGSAY